MRPFLFLGLVALLATGGRAQSTPPSLAGISGGGSVELGQRVVLQVLASGNTTGSTYLWRKAGAELPGGTAASYVIPVIVASDAGTYSITVTNAAGSSVATTEITVKPAAAPVITTQPRNVVAQVGQTATFTVVATGSFPRTYQWRKDGTDLPGATDVTLTLPNITTLDAGVYAVQVGNAVGSVTSTSASLTVNAATPPVLFSLSPGDATFIQGQSASIGVTISSGSSPFTYQWLKGGVALPGATAAQLTLAAITLADAGRYAVIVTNIAGSATSREALVSVTPATAIIVGRGPESLSVAIGQPATFSVSVATGSTPLTYQWLRNGTPIAGATLGSYSIAAVSTADAGAYTVTVSNVLGSVTAPSATLTVTPALAPTITTQPLAQNVAFSGTILLSVAVSGTPAFTYQWRRDGVAIDGATSGSYTVINATPAHNGVYTVVVGNRAGTVTSNGATVTVVAAAPPAISRPPAAAEVALGLVATFSAGVSTSGTGLVSYQWLKDGVPVAGANSIELRINSVREVDAGDYTIVVTGAGGSVTSTPARLTVLPPAPPRVTGRAGGWSYIELGGRAGFSIDSTALSGTPPFTYEWSKDGAVIPGATTNAISFPAVAPSDYGTYTVTIANEGGVYTSPGMRLRYPTPAQGFPANAPWLDAGQVGTTVYFLAMQPARVERYDLANERWLPTALLSTTQFPTAFVPAEDGVYIAYGRVLARRPLDLSTETVIANAPADIRHLFAFGDLIYYAAPASAGGNSPGYSSVSRTTFQPGPASAIGRSGGGGFINVAVSAALRKGFGRSLGSTSEVESFNVAGNGAAMTAASNASRLGVAIGARIFLFPNDRFVADDSGSVFLTSDLSFAGSLGESLTDLVFLADGTPVTLRGPRLATARLDTFVETGRATVAQPGQRIFTQGQDVFVFSSGTATSPFTATKVARSAFVAVAPPVPPAMPIGRYSIDDAFLGEDNVVYVLSRTLRAFLRWDPVTRAFLAPLALRSSPSLVFHQPGNSRALLYYTDGMFTEIPLRAGGVERGLGNLGNEVTALTDLGDMFEVNFRNWRDSGDTRVIYTNTYPKAFATNLYHGAGLAWVGPARRFYSVPAFSGGLQYERVAPDGTLVTASNGSPLAFSTSASVTPPIRFNPEHTLLATMNGRVFSADLSQVGVLANSPLDAAWLSSGLYTIRTVAGETELQQWSRATYLQTGRATIRGAPVRLLRLSDRQLIVVSSRQGFLTFTVVNADLTFEAAPDPRSLAGVYFAKLGAAGSAGDVALEVRGNGTGVLLAHLPNRHTALYSRNVSVTADGFFLVNALDLITGTTRTVAGRISADGAVAGSIPTLDLTFAGDRTTGGAHAGYYQAPAVNGGVGSAYAIVGADGRGVVVAQGVGTVEGGMVAANSAGVMVLTTSTGARLSVTIDAGTGAITATADRDALANTVFAGLRDDVVRTDRLGNISTRGRANTGDDALIAGFVISGRSARTVLIRAIGPALGNFGVAGALSDPKLVLFRGGTQLAESDNWSVEPGAAAISAASNLLGAFGLPSPGRDAVLLATLDPGGYTAQVTAATGGGGVSLVEVYDAGTATGNDEARLVNIATRGRVGTGEDVLIAGIVVTGNAPKRLLVRAIGPTLGTFGVTGALADPVLTLLSGTRTLATNDDWSNGGAGSTGPEVAAAALSVGAFALPAASRDSSLLMTLLPGNYTAQVSGKGAATGLALVEVYEVNP